MQSTDKDKSMNEGIHGATLTEKVNEKADILKVVSYYLGSNNIIRQGKAYKALCPFHDDHNPSMNINPERNTYKCFTCGHGGMSVKFVEEYAHLSRIDAIKKVCEICSIPLPKDFHGNTVEDNFRKEHQKELEAMEFINRFYRLSLQSKGGSAAMDYLTKRGISKEVIDHFSIGFAPDDSSLSINALRENGYEIRTLESAGIITSNSSELLDRYSHRIMFPIHDNYGRLVAFSGRIIDKLQDGGKYVNSPETSLFKKSEVMYHFYKAREEAIRCGHIYLVEGYMDAIALVRAGIVQVAALMGTALTKEHIETLKKLKVEVRLCLDSDEAGQEGEERALKLLVDSGIQYRIVRRFTKGKDADEVLTQYGEETLKAQLNRLVDPYLFLLRRTLGDRDRMTDSEEISSFLRKAVPYFSKLDDIAKEKDIGFTSKVCSLSAESIRKMLENLSVRFKKVENVIPEKDVEQIEKKTYQKKEYRGFKHRFIESEPMVPVKVSSSYDPAMKINRIKEKIFSLDGSDDYIRSLIDNECEILIMLPHAFDAFYDFESAKTDLVFAPIRILANLIGNIYGIHYGSKEPFHEMDYSDLKGSLKGYFFNNVEDDSDPLGLEDDIEEKPKIDSSMKDTLESIIDEIEALSDNCYDKDKLMNALELHCLYSKYDVLLKQNIDDDKKLIEKIRLSGQIKKKGGYLE